MNRETFNSGKRTGAEQKFNFKKIASLIFIALFALHNAGLVAAQTTLNRPASIGKTPSPLRPSAAAASSGIVVSQIYGGGGNAGATYKNDFIELFNRGNAPVSLSGYSVQYASSAGASWQVTTLTAATLQPGQYYLVQEMAGAGGTANLPTPDATGTIAMSAAAGKVLVASTTTAATDATATSLGANRIDIVSYGTAANATEGSPTATLTNTTAALRNGGGCSDTDNNSADFTVGAPNPRNTVTALSACNGTSPTNPSGTGAANPNPVVAGQPVTLTVTVTPGTNPAGSGHAVTADLTALGGAADQTFYDDGTNGDAAAGDNIFTFMQTVPAVTSGGAKSLPVTITDQQDRTGTAAISLTVTSNATALAVTAAANPNPVTPTGTTLLTATVTPGTNPASTNITVQGNLSALGGAAAQTFYDDGTNGDQAAGDKTFSYNAAIPADATGGTRSVTVTAADAQSRTATATISVVVNGPVDQNEHITMGNPSGATNDVNNPTNYLMLKSQYAESYHRDRGIPNWVSWHLDPTWLGSAPRQNDFRPDDTLPSDWYHVKMTDYSGSGFDRGHHCPSGDRTSTAADNSATFLMTNMMPQAPDNNQGTWESLEAYSRTLVGQGSELYIIAGGQGQGGVGSNGALATVAAGRVVVPKYTWKVVMVLPQGDNDVSRVTNATRVFAVIMPNIQGVRSDPWQKYLTSVRQVEALTGYDFFSNVPVDIQNVIESRIDAASNTSPQTLAGGTFTDLTVNTPNTTLTGNITVTGTLTIGADVIVTGSNKITLGPNATIVRQGGYIVGNLERQFAAPAANVLFPVGTNSGGKVDPTTEYSPVILNVTNVGIANSSLTVKANAGVQPNVTTPLQTLKRYWTLTENGDLTADITFRYLDGDVPAGVSESEFQLNKYENNQFTVLPSTTDVNANTTTTANVSQFSDWTMIGPVPSAAGARIGGRVFASYNKVVAGAVITLTNSQGQVRTVKTNGFGNFAFNDVPTGSVYVVNVSARQYKFIPQAVNLTDDLTGLSFMAQP